MKVVSVMNYKGGVGKTTLTANIGAEIARWGKRVLLIDLDPQASLTFSFYRPEDWRAHLAEGRTIKQWFEAWRMDGPVPGLEVLVTAPTVANSRIAHNGGRLDLIASHLALGDVEMDLAARLGGAQIHRSTRHYFDVYLRLAAGLATLPGRLYDLALIDCPPNFGVITRSAVAASDQLLIPARPDELSTLGIDHLQSRLRRFTWEFNQVADLQADLRPAVKKLEPMILGVVFTMVQYYGGQPVSALRPYIAQTRSLGLPVFDAMLRESNKHFAGAARAQLPAILTEQLSRELAWELQSLVEEFLKRIRTANHGS
ncbi:ATPase involved in chromosome partitioning [Frankia sp. CcI6]|uniref:ParA family protein n=1 Tax=unclassified Frankia TaxID=2632575 RepID=UPI0003D043D1|nr:MULTISPECIES: ParA family protein [unclassified Frankia]ETA00534.1 ATPase involved in chromosome partitioning [Frankia sp. CcI6]OAA21185.1 chromosome partitioning protein [Frankia casuarinae]OHV51681.1 chromosome partitioning protein ParA [Frankia sp. CgIS1]